MTMQFHSSVSVDNLFATSVIPVMTEIMTVAQGQKLKRGAFLTEAGVLASSTTTGSGETAVTTYDDVYAVLADDVDTTEKAIDAAVYLTGEFNEKALSVATGTVADYKASARKVSIFIKRSM